MAEKNEFLVVHDYQTGGLWAVIQARSSEEIRLKYPGLTNVYEPGERPHWMTTAEYSEIAATSTEDIDEPALEWLALMVSADSNS